MRIRALINVTGFILCVLLLANTPVLAHTAKGRTTKNSLQWKMVWMWVTPAGTSNAELIAQAKSLGFNAIAGVGSALIEECHKQGIQAVGVICFGGAPKQFAQVMSPIEEARRQQAQISPSPIYQYGGEPIQAGEIFTDSDIW